MNFPILKGGEVLENHQPGLMWRLWKRVFVSFVLLLIICICINTVQAQLVTSKNIILQGSIQIQSAKAAINSEQTGKIQPGTPVKITVIVENRGEHESPVGQLYVRYAFAHPLDKEATSIIFETEKKPLPTIEPGKKVEIRFDTIHQIPSLLDFIRYDWSMREYQAITTIDKKDYTIGTLALTFSAYYYPGFKKEIPTQVSSNPY